MTDQSTEQNSPKVVFTFYSSEHPSGRKVEVGSPRLTPLIPRKGELVTGPDSMGSFRVEDVDYVYSDGLYFAPTIWVRCVKPGAFGQ